MEFRFSYWRSGFAVFLSLFFIIISIVTLILGKGNEEERFILYFIIVTFLPILFFSIFTLRQIPKDKIKDMSLKERRAYKLKQIQKNGNST